MPFRRDAGATKSTVYFAVCSAARQRPGTDGVVESDETADVEGGGPGGGGLARREPPSTDTKMKRATRDTARASVHVAQCVVHRVIVHKRSVVIDGLSWVARRLQRRLSMAEITTLPASFTTALKQVFRSYTVDMLSTDDGRRAIRLVSHDGPALVVGWVDLVGHCAELSTLGHALSLSKEQMGRELRLPPVEYLRFLERAAAVLGDFGMTVTIVTHARKSCPPSPLATTTSGRSPSPAPYYGIIAASASLIGAIAWLIAQ